MPGEPGKRYSWSDSPTVSVTVSDSPLGSIPICCCRQGMHMRYLLLLATRCLLQRQRVLKAGRAQRFVSAEVQEFVESTLVGRSEGRWNRGLGSAGICRDGAAYTELH